MSDKGNDNDPKGQDAASLKKLLLQVGATLLAAGVVNICVGLYVFGQMSSDMRHMQEDINKMEMAVQDTTRNRYTADNAQADKEMMLQLLSAINVRIDQNERRIARLEDK